MQANDAMTAQQLAEGLFYYGFVFLATLSFVIFVHELGHYLLARRFGVRIPKFSVGFGKEIFGFNDRRGTRWCMSWIPLGGYVSIYGDVDPQNPLIWDEELKAARLMNEKELSEAFCSKSVLQRSLIVVAGPAINLLLTFIILVTLYMAVGVGYDLPVINAVATKTPASEAGFEIGDKILRMDGKPIKAISEIYDQTFEHAGREFTFDILRGEQELTLKLTPVEESYTDLKGVDRKHGRTGMVNLGNISIKEMILVDGIDTKDNPDLARSLILERFDRPILVTLEFRKDQVDEFLVLFPKEFNTQFFDNITDEKDDFVNIKSVTDRHYRKLWPIEAFVEVCSQIAEGLKETYKLFNAVFSGKSNERVVSGVADISDKVGKSAKDGFYQFFVMVALLSFMIALINILPIPAFDGGYLLFFLIEFLFGKPLPRKVQDYAMILGLVLIGGIMIFANMSDFFRLFD